MPVLKILDLGPSRISGNLLTPIADGTGVFVKFFDLAPCDLQAFAVVPGMIS